MSGDHSGRPFTQATQSKWIQKDVGTGDATRHRVAVRTPGRRSAYTLPELLIVLAILAALAGLALPAMRNPLDRSRLRSAASDVRTILTKARAIAVREGQVVSFACESGGSGYRLVRSTAPTLPVRVAADSAEAARTPSGLMADDPQLPEPETAASPSSSGMDHSHAAGHTLWSGRLPDGVTFADHLLPASPFTDIRSAEGGRSGGIPEQHRAAEPATVGQVGAASRETTATSQGATRTVRWISGPEFLPNGRTEDFSLQLAGARGFRVNVRVRGLTGAVSYSAAYRQEGRDGPVPRLDATESIP